MRKTFVIILTLIGFIALGQENKLDRIDNEVNSIELDSTLTLTEFDWAELTGISTDGGGILKVWRNTTQICKIVEEVFISIGKLETTIYLESGNPIKIIEKEDYFEQMENELNYTKLEEVFRAEIYVLDWKNKISTIKSSGTRAFSDSNLSNFNYDQIIKRAETAIKK